MTEQAGHEKDIIIGNGYKICYGRHRLHGFGWFFLDGRFTKNESVAFRWSEKLRDYLYKNNS